MHAERTTTTSPRSVQLLAGIGIVTIAVVSVFRPLRDFDLPWNLATGRIIWATKAIPQIDDLAFTHGKLRYVEFLSDLPLYAIQRLGDGVALQGFGAIVAVSILLLIRASLRESGPISWLAVGAIAATVLPWCELRPATLSFPLLLVTIVALARHRESPENWRALAWLVITQLLWANTHGFAAIGAALIAGYAVYRLLARHVAGRLGAWLPERDGTNCVRSIGICVVALGTTCLNTAGPALLLGPFRFGEQLSNITEWARPSSQYFLTQQPVATAVLLLSVLAYVFGRERDGSRIPPLFTVGLALLATSGTFVAVRLLPLALLLLVPLAAMRLAWFVRSSPLLSHTCALTPMLAGVWLGLTLKTTPEPGFDPTWLPVDATRYVQKHNFEGRPYNFMPFGGYLAWKLHPGQRIFMDGRNQLARPASVVARATLAERDSSAFAQLVDDYNLEWAMTRAADGERFDRPLAQSRRWIMVYLDDVAAVYVRRDGVNRQQSTSGYEVLRHLIPPNEVLALALNPSGRGEALARDAVRAASQAPMSPRAAFLEACGGIAIGDLPMFERGLHRLVQLDPNHPAVAILIHAQRLQPTWRTAAPHSSQEPP